MPDPLDSPAPTPERPEREEAALPAVEPPLPDRPRAAEQPAAMALHGKPLVEDEPPDTEPTGLEEDFLVEPGGVELAWSGEAVALMPTDNRATAAPIAAGATMQGVRSAGVVLALVCILALGAYFRFTGVNWDSNTHLHPDERFITMVQTAIEWPKSVAEYFDTARSPLNPYNRGYNSFVYGTFPLFLVKWLGNVVDMRGYDEIHLLGRVVSAIFDLGSVLLIFLIGRRLYGVRAGLLAALLSTAMVTQIQQSHFFTFDTFVAFFLLASFFFAVRIWQGDRWYDYPLLGASLGLAVACKINSVVFLLIVGLLALKQLREVSVASERDRMGGWLRVVGLFSTVAVAALLLFRVAEPYAFTGPSFLNLGLNPKFLGDMAMVQKMASGEIDQPPSVQWANTTPYLFPLQNLILWGMGLPLGLVGWLGLAFAGYRLLAKGESRHLLIVVWVSFFFWFLGGQLSKTMRYFLPIVPLLALLGSHLLLELNAALRGWLARRESPEGATRGLMARPSDQQDDQDGQETSPRLVFADAARRLAAHGGAALIALVAVGTVLYAFAFTRIYTEPVTRITATEWIFENVPRGAATANEHWDDPLPLRWKGKDGGMYRGMTLEMYADDNPEKLRKLTGQLDQADYIFVTSDRLYGSIPRIPQRYPMSTEYYRLLFAEELGFKLVKTFTSYPTLFGLELNNDAAEEIFRNYDHPKVLIFQKSPEYSPQKVRELLGAVPLDRVLPLKSVQASRNGLLLSDGERAVQERGGTWSEIYHRQGVANRFPVLSWWLAIQLLGLLALPLAWSLFRRFPDRGYGLAKVLGLLVVSYVAWLLPSLQVVGFGRLSIFLGIVVVAASAFLVLRRNWAEFRDSMRSRTPLILAHEVVFLAAFTLFWMIRASNPDLWHLNFGGEKPMEFAYLNAVAKSTFFPPYDPWLAGGYINYYYFGYVIVATLMRLTGIVPEVAFNLAIASIFALTAAGLFSFGYNYWATVRRAVLSGWAMLSGLGVALFVLIVGNLDGIIQILEALWRLGGLQLKSTIPFMEGGVKALAGLSAVVLGGKAFPAFDFWRSTRIVGPLESPTPIMEFPYFTFLYGDLHPHMISMPIATLALALILAIVWQGRSAVSHQPSAISAQHPARNTQSSVLSPQSSVLSPQSSEPASALRYLRTHAPLILLAGLVVGALQATNSWDYPTYLLLISVAFLLGGFARDGALSLRCLTDALLAAGAVYLVAQLLFLPFTRAYELFYNGVDPAQAKTLVQHYLVMFGFFLFCAGSLLLLGLSRNRWHRYWVRDLWERLVGSSRGDRRAELSELLVRPTPWMELLPVVALALAGMVLMALVLRLFLVALLLVVGLMALLSLFDRKAPPEKLLLALFVGMAAALTLGVEFVTIKGDIGRMNTVFKFYLQAWFLFGIVSALAVAWIVAGWRSRHAGPWSGRRWSWILALALLFASVLIYPLCATPVKVAARFNPIPPTLDGMAYMKQATFKDQNRDIVLARDYAAIRWLQDRVVGSPVVLEAQVPEYRLGSRIANYTGLPTILGWTWHQRQQRSGYQWMIEQRLRDIKMAFESTDIAAVSAILRRYDVGLIYVGDLERAYYPPAGLAKFDAMVGSALSVAYQAEGVTIYEVMRQGQPGVVLASD